MKIGELGQLRVASRLACQAQIVHRHEDGIGADQRKEEMDSRQLLVHHSAEHLWEPVVGCGKDTENGGYTHYQMKMAPHQGRVVEPDNQPRPSHNTAAQSA